MSGIEIHGLEELIKALDEAPAKIEKQILTAALDEYAKDLSDLIRQAAPFDANDKNPGFYPGGKKAGGAFAHLPHLKFSIEPINANTTKGSVRRRIMANYYARFVEKGTKFHFPDKFIQPVMEASGAYLLQRLVNDIAEKVGKTVGNN